MECEGNFRPHPHSLHPNPLQLIPPMELRRVGLAILGSTLNRDTNFYQNRHFLRQKWTSILVRPQQMNHNGRVPNLLRDG